MPIKDLTPQPPELTPTVPPPTVEHGEYQVRLIVRRMRNVLIRQTSNLRALADQHGRTALVNQINNTNAGDAAELLAIYQSAKSLIQQIDDSIVVDDL